MTISTVTTSTGLKYVDEKVGEGASPQKGKRVTGATPRHAPGGKKVGQLGGWKGAVRIRHRGRPGDRGLGRGRDVDEGRRTAQAHHPRQPRLRRARRRRRDSAQRRAALR